MRLQCNDIFYILLGGEGRVATLARSRMNGLLPLERIIEQTTVTMPLAPKTIATATLEDQYNFKFTIV